MCTKLHEEQKANGNIDRCSTFSLDKQALWKDIADLHIYKKSLKLRLHFKGYLVIAQSRYSIKMLYAK